jgi:hypothetical protein
MVESPPAWADGLDEESPQAVSPVKNNPHVQQSKPARFRSIFDLISERTRSHPIVDWSARV